MTLHPSAFVGALLSVGGTLLVLLLRQGTVQGAAAGAIVSLFVTAGFGAGAFWPLALFVLGSGAMTRMGRERKEAIGAAERNRGMRGPSHVIAKLGLPTLLGLLAIGGVGSAGILSLAYAAALAGAFADTAATEIGPLGGGTVVAVRGLRLARVQHGASGGASLAGLATAAVASAALAGTAWAAGLLTTVSGVVVVGSAGFLATVLESALAATPIGTRLGHFGRNAFVSVASAAMAFASWRGGWIRL